jgi:hypothetical protein
MFFKTILLVFLISYFEIIDSHNLIFNGDDITTLGPCKAQLQDGSIIDLCKNLTYFVKFEN